MIATLSFTGWLLVARDYLPDPEWVHFGFSLFLGSILAAVVLVIRARNLEGVEKLRMGDRVRQIEMESALSQTERARRGEEEARRALEGAIVQVRESEQRFRGLADATFEGVVIFRNGHVVDANTRAAELFGVSVPQLLGAPVLNLVAEGSMDDAARVLEGGGGHGEGLDLDASRYDGSLFPMAVSVVSTVHQEKNAKVMVIRDITDRRRVELVLRRALEEAEGNSRAKSTFLANMSHELRTPLNSVIGFANILMKRLGDELPVREMDYLKRIQSNGEHLLSLIDDILDLSKIDAERMEIVREPLQLDELVGEVLRTLDVQARKMGLELRSEVPGELRPLVADARRMLQILLNLAGNAVKFTPSGSVTIRVLAEEDSGRPARIEVSDTGIGIPAYRLEEIFSPFNQVDSSSARSFGGTGLGLTIARSLCELMGFDLYATSRKGEGSTFVIELDPGRGPRAHDRPSALNAGSVGEPTG
ncbi:MAG: PAS domain S-box protein [Gemmatimonadetes bacterium]|nr:PAS domain S-box protein [Gemmatimonadota bacterium]